MASPVLPSDAEEVVIKPEDSFCTSLKKLLIRWPILFYQYTKYKYQEDGTFTSDFIGDMCDGIRSGCPDMANDAEEDGQSES